MDYAAGGMSRRSFLKAAAAIGVSASVRTLLAACGRAREREHDSSSSGSSSGKPVQGGTFTEGYDRDFTPPNPVNTPGRTRLQRLFEALVMRNPEGNIVPMLADSFTSGPTGVDVPSPVRAEVPIGCAADPGASSRTSTSSQPQDRAEPVILDPITETSDGQTIICKTKDPFQAFQETICTEYSYIMNPVTWKAQGASYGTKPTDGTGPFVLTATCRPARHRKALGGVPGLDRAVLHQQGQGLPRRGQVDSDHPGLPARAADPDGTSSTRSRTPPPQESTPSRRTRTSWSRNSRNSPISSSRSTWATSRSGFNDLRVRQAISHAIDREEIV